MYQVQVLKDKELDEGLSDLAIKIESPFTKFDLASPLYQDFRDIERDEFNSKGRGEWPPNAEATITAKADFIPLIMRESDRLFLSLTSQTSDSVFEVQPNAVTFGTRVPYADYHMRPYKKRPARPPIRRELRPQDLERMLKTVRKTIRGTIRSSRKPTFVQTELADFEHFNDEF